MTMTGGTTNVQLVVKGSVIKDDNPFPVKLIGSDIVEQLTEADAVDNVLTFSDVIHAVEIVHEEETWQTFVVNGISLKLPQGVYRTGVGGTPSVSVTIPAGITCTIGRLV